jgi:hypothetical protein
MAKNMRFQPQLFDSMKQAHTTNILALKSHGRLTADGFGRAVGNQHIAIRNV